MLNTVVIHFIDGKLQKGVTDNFFPNKSMFHIREKETAKTHEISLKQLKAIFFVKDFTGNREYREKLNVERVGLGKKIRVIFKDGETLVGYTQGFSPERLGFFIFPCDPDSNNNRIFVITDATKQVSLI